MVILVAWLTFIVRTAVLVLKRESMSRIMLSKRAWLIWVLEANCIKQAGR